MQLYSNGVYKNNHSKRELLYCSFRNYDDTYCILLKLYGDEIPVSKSYKGITDSDSRKIYRIMEVFIYDDMNQLNRFLDEIGELTMVNLSINAQGELSETLTELFKNELNQNVKIEFKMSI